MSGQVNGFTFFRSYLDALAEMDDKTKLETLLAIVSYGLDGEYPELNSPISRAIFSIAKPVLDSSRESVLNGKKGGRPRKNPPFSEKENLPFGKSESNKKENLECEREKESVNAAEPHKHTHFTPPTVKEVSAYCNERGNKIDPQRFVDFYASKGWKVGQTKMRDWKAAVRNWERNGFSTQAGKKTADVDYTAPPGFDFV